MPRTSVDSPAAAGAPPVRVGADWLRVREPADAAARATDLVDLLCRRLPSGRPTVVHDLGCGTGSMGRWLAPRLPGRQHWVLTDHDADLLALASGQFPTSAADGAPVTVDCRRLDVTRLGRDDLAGADLVTASALLDMFTREGLDRFLQACTRPRCPVLLSLSVTGGVELAPADPLDTRVTEAFNAHQRRTVHDHALLGPDAPEAAAAALTRLGFAVTARPSPWRLGAGDTSLALEWFRGWLAAACEQDPALTAHAAAYAARRLAQASAGGLRVTVHHVDVLAQPAR